MMFKALALVYFWSVLLLKEQIMTSVRKTLKILVWSAQSRSISSEFSLKITTKSTVFYRLRMLFGEVCPQNSSEIGRFFREFVPQNLAKFDFFPRPIRSPGYYGAIHHIWKWGLYEPERDAAWTSPEVICSQSASLRMLGAKLQRVFFTFRTRGWHLQRFQKTWVVSTEFDLELNFLLLPYRQNCFSKSMKMLFIVKKYQTNILICVLLQVNWLPLWWMDNTQTRRVRYQSRKLASKSNLVY